MPQVTFGAAPDPKQYPSTLRGYLQALRDTVRPTGGREGFTGPFTFVQDLEPLVPVEPPKPRPFEGLEVLDTLFRGVSSRNASPLPTFPESRVPHDPVFDAGSGAGSVRQQQQDGHLPQTVLLPIQANRDP